LAARLTASLLMRRAIFRGCRCQSQDLPATDAHRKGVSSIMSYSDKVIKGQALSSIVKTTSTTFFCRIISYHQPSSY